VFTARYDLNLQRQFRFIFILRASRKYESKCVKLSASYITVNIRFFIEGSRRESDGFKKKTLGRFST